MKVKNTQKYLPNNRFFCPNCGNLIHLNQQMFLDVSAWPNGREKLMDLSLFNKRCTHCGEEVYIEHPLEYLDEARGFAVLLVPNFDEDLVEIINSMSKEAFSLGNFHTYRLVSSAEELVEKILIFEKGRDDVVIEIYKVFLRGALKNEWPQMKPESILYYNDVENEYFVIWDNIMTPGHEKLTVYLDEIQYDEIVTEFGDKLRLPDDKKYWVIDDKFVKKHILE